jgi:hypothetical protein
MAAKYLVATPSGSPYFIQVLPAPPFSPLCLAFKSLLLVLLLVRVVSFFMEARSTMHFVLLRGFLWPIPFVVLRAPQNAQPTAQRCVGFPWNVHWTPSSNSDAALVSLCLSRTRPSTRPWWTSPTRLPPAGSSRSSRPCCTRAGSQGAPPRSSMMPP